MATGEGEARHRVLLVDVDDAVLSMMTQSLDSKGFEVLDPSESLV